MRRIQMSELYQSLSPSKWDCKYHVVFVPKRRRKTILGQARRQLGAIFQALARQKECQIIEGHWMPDQVPICIAISPQCGRVWFLSVSGVIVVSFKPNALHPRTQSAGKDT